MAGLPAAGTAVAGVRVSDQLAHRLHGRAPGAWLCSRLCVPPANSTQRTPGGAASRSRRPSCTGTVLVGAAVEHERWAHRRWPMRASESNSRRRDRRRDAAPEAGLGGHVGHAREGRFEDQRAVVACRGAGRWPVAPPPHRPSSGRRSRAARARAGGAAISPQATCASAMIVSSEGTMARAVAPAAVVDGQDREAGVAQRLDLGPVAVEVAEACRAGTASVGACGSGCGSHHSASCRAQRRAAAATATVQRSSPGRCGRRPASAGRAGVGRSASCRCWPSSQAQPPSAASSTAASPRHRRGPARQPRGLCARRRAGIMAGMMRCCTRPARAAFLPACAAGMVGRPGGAGRRAATGFFGDGHWRVALSPYSLHFSPSAEHKPVQAVALERQYPDDLALGWLVLHQLLRAAQRLRLPRPAQQRAAGPAAALYAMDGRADVRLPRAVPGEGAAQLQRLFAGLAAVAGLGIRPALLGADQPARRPPG